MHVFVTAGLCSISSEKEQLTIFEVGFGTGLNAILAYQYAVENDIQMHYQSVENYPLNVATISELGYSSFLSKEEKKVFEKMHACEWNQDVLIADSFSIEKIQGDLDLCIIPKKANVIFFDAFSPDKQPELWTVEVFKKMFESLELGGVLVTYCAKGQVRRNMIEVGFQVERIPGPPGKREMLRAVK